MPTPFLLHSLSTLPACLLLQNPKVLQVHPLSVVAVWQSGLE